MPDPTKQTVSVGIHDIPLAAYLADPCPSPSLRSHDLNEMLTRTPAHVRAGHPRLTQFPEAVRVRTAAMDLGSVVHSLVLGGGSEYVVMSPSDFMTKKGTPAETWGAAEAKAAKQEAEARGLIVLDAATMDKARDIAARIADKLASEFGAWPIGKTEQTLAWQEHTEHGIVYCRARPDILAPDLGVIVDLKSSAAGLSDDDLQRTLSYDNGSLLIQAAWQKRGASMVMPEMNGRFEHTHIYIETEPPYEPRIINASVMGLVMAERRCLRAAAMFAHCLNTNDWPGWPKAVIGPAQWLDTKWMAAEETEG